MVAQLMTVIGPASASGERSASVAPSSRRSPHSNSPVRRPRLPPLGTRIIRALEPDHHHLAVAYASRWAGDNPDLAAAVGVAVPSAELVREDGEPVTTWLFW